jgi:alkanesulfonate monooxygenase SsuD/methylene tetrahydromethanopterin reductase-like flavin-dependent oxidoreductase (luciferase family)
MRLGMFMMPLHPAQRAPSVTLEEDRQAVILADRLGYHDAFVGEHLTEKSENVTNSFIFLATLIHATCQIRLATGTSNLSHTHPTLVAAHAAMFDHLARGRFIFGISPGALASDAEALGMLDQDRNKLFAESINAILAIWERNAPYNIDFPDNRFKISTAKTAVAEIERGEMYKPYQLPRPEIVGTVVAPFSKGVIAMGERDFHPLSANFLLSKYLRSHWENYSEGKRRAGRVADVADWRIARTIFVADDEATARRYAIEDAASPYRYYWSLLLKKMLLSKRAAIFKEDPAQDDATLDIEYMLDRLVIWGTPSRVADRILALREEAGDFGEIVYANMDWVDERLARRSIELMATEVMPRVNAAIGASAAPTARAA